MSGKVLDITGNKYNMLTVIKYDGNGIWTLKCDCGNIVHMRTRNFKYGQNRGCGCMAHANSGTHKLSNTRIYSIWEAMKARCQNKHNKYYRHYGGRGIVLCDEWQKFEPFYEWSMNNGYMDNLTIDRIDSNGNYEPNNCRWSTRKVQANNTRRNIYIEYNGKTKTQAEWADLLGISYDTMRWRFRHWTIEKALTEPINESYSRKRLRK
jgi:hypothetical protein